MEQLNGFITTKGAAKVLGISRRGVFARIYKKNIPTIRVGNVVLVQMKDLDCVRPSGRKVTQ